MTTPGRVSMLFLSWLTLSCVRDPRGERPIRREVDFLTQVATEFRQQEFGDETALFDALNQMRSREPGSDRPVQELLGFPGFERRFYLGPSPAPEAMRAPSLILALTSSSNESPQLAFCADTSLTICVRRDGFEPRVRAGRCDDPRCEVFAKGEQLTKASHAFFGH